MNDTSALRSQPQQTVDNPPTVGTIPNESEIKAPLLTVASTLIILAAIFPTRKKEFEDVVKTLATIAGTAAAALAGWHWLSSETGGNPQEYIYLPSAAATLTVIIWAIHPAVSTIWHKTRNRLKKVAPKARKTMFQVHHSDGDTTQMHNEKEVGIFWLPDNPEAQVEGKISLEIGKRTILKLNGELKPYAQDNEEQTVIEGVLSNSHVKLVGCLETAHRTSIGKFIHTAEQSWFCHLAFHGSEYGGNVPNEITSAEITIEDIDKWIPSLRKFTLGKDELSISWPANERQRTATWTLGEVTIHQTVRHWPAWPSYAVSEASAKTLTTIRVDFSEPQKWSRVLHTVTDIQSLVSIATGKTPNVEQVKIVQKGSPDVRLIALYHPVLLRGSKPNNHSNLFTLKEIGGVQGIAQWLNTLCNQEFLTSPLLVDRYRQPAFVTDVTSHLLMACEAYFRSSIANPSKQVTLRQEILEPMAQTAGKPFEEWIGNPKTWIEKVSQIRNLHGVAHLQGYANWQATSLDFNLVNDQLYLMTVLCILLKCGVNKDINRKIIRRMTAEAVTYLPAEE